MAIFLSVSKITRRGQGRENRGQGSGKRVRENRDQGQVWVPTPCFLSSHADTLFVSSVARRN